MKLPAYWYENHARVKSAALFTHLITCAHFYNIDLQWSCVIDGTMKTEARKWTNWSLDLAESDFANTNTTLAWQVGHWCWTKGRVKRLCEDMSLLDSESVPNGIMGQTFLKYYLDYITFMGVIRLIIMNNYFLIFSSWLARSLVTSKCKMWWKIDPKK